MHVSLLSHPQLMVASRSQLCGRSTTGPSLRFTFTFFLASNHKALLVLPQRGLFSSFSSLSLVLPFWFPELIFLHRCPPPQPSCLCSHPFRPPPDTFVHLSAYARHTGGAHKMLAHSTVFQKKNLRLLTKTCNINYRRGEPQT